MDALEKVQIVATSGTRTTISRTLSRYFIIIPTESGFGGLVVSMLASGTQDRGFDPGRSRRIFRAKKSTACLACGGSKAVSHVADLRGMSKGLRGSRNHRQN